MSQDYEPLSVSASAARIVAELENPLSAITVIGSDLQTLVGQWESYRTALGRIASPSFMSIAELRKIAWEALRT